MVNKRMHFTSNIGRLSNESPKIGEVVSCSIKIQIAVEKDKTFPNSYHL